MEKILAKVGTLTVTEGEVNDFIAELGPRGQSYNTPEGRRAVLEQIISSKLLLLDARRNLLETEPEFKAAIARVRETMLANYAAEKVVGAVKVSDDEVLAYYNENKDQFMEGEHANASHILVDSEEKAKEILEKISTGSISFEDAASEYSKCPSKERGGNLGDFTHGQMVPEFDSAVFAMNEGEISLPVKTQFGYHLIKLNSKSEASVAPFEAVATELHSSLLNKKRHEAYQKKVNQLKILYPVELV